VRSGCLGVPARRRDLVLQLIGEGLIRGQCLRLTVRSWREEANGLSGTGNSTVPVALIAVVHSQKVVRSGSRSIPYDHVCESRRGFIRSTCKEQGRSVERRDPWVILHFQGAAVRTRRREPLVPLELNVTKRDPRSRRTRCNANGLPGD
jgi:hypothetical protein